MEDKKITAKSVMFDLVEKYPETQEVFKKYDQRAGQCVMCHNLFDTLESFTKAYDFDLKVIISELEAIVK